MYVNAMCVQYIIEFMFYKFMACYFFWKKPERYWSVINIENFEINIGNFEINIGNIEINIGNIEINIGNFAPSKMYQKYEQQ